MASSAQTAKDLSGVLVAADLQAADYLVVAPVAIPILFGALLVMMRRKVEWHGHIAAIGTVLLLLSTFGLMQRVLETGPVTMTMGRWLPPFGIAFSADLAGSLLAFTSSFVAFTAIIYSAARTPALTRRYAFYPFLMLMLAGISGAFLTGDIFNLYVWFEVLLISSFGLIVLGSEREQLDGTIKYAFLNLVATTMFLAATGYLYGILGTLNMADILIKLREPGLEGPVMTIAILFFLAFAMKAAAFPLNFWLPASYHTPKIVVSAVFAGLLTKVGIYALLRVSLMLFAAQRDALENGIAWIAALTMLTGVFGALAQSDIRRILGFLVIAGIGTMLAGIAVATQTGITGVMVYAIHSMIVMMALYLAAGFVGRLSGSFELRDLGGAYAASPMLAGGFFILALSVAGLPPTSGFWAKFILVRAALETGAWWLAGVILVAGLLTAIAIFRVWSFVFWRGGPESTSDGAEAWSVLPITEEYRFHTALALGLLITASLAIGFAPELLVSTAADAAHGLLYPLEYVDSVFGSGPR